MTPTMPLDAAEEHPEELPDQEPAPDYGPNNEDLPEQLRNALKTMIERASEQEKYLRRREVMRDRKLRFYERGMQHVTCNSSTGMFSLMIPGAVTQNGFQQQYETPNYIGDYNIFEPYMRVIQSVLTQNPPGVDFQAINPGLDEDVQAAKVAENYRTQFDRTNDVKAIQTDIVRMFEVSARTIIWTRTEANGQKWGFDENNQPKRMETASVYGSLESRVPILAKCMEDYGFCLLFDDPDVLDAKAKYPKFKDKIKAGTSGLGESAYERWARLGVLQGSTTQNQTGESLTHMVTRINAWLRPARYGYEGFEEVFEEGDGGETVQDALARLFPLGVHAVFCGDVYVGCWAESMDDALTVGFPYAGDGQFRLAIMDPAVIVQDEFNDMKNWAREYFDTGGPETWVDCDEEEYDSILNQRANPNSIRMKKLTSAQKMPDAVMQTTGPVLSPSFVNYLTDDRDQLLQFMLASPPVIQGGAMPDQKTASGIAQLASHAMGQQAIWFAAIQAMMARMYYQAALCASRNPDHSEEIVIPGKGGQNVSLELSRITKGKFGAYPDEDSSFPETTQQKRQTLQGLIALAAGSPLFLQALMQSPENWATFNKINGLPELHFQQQDSYDKQTFEIEQLLKGAPIPPSPQEVQAADAQFEQAQVAHASSAVAAGATGAPEPPAPVPPNAQSLTKPSVQVQLLDYHQYEFEKCKEWLSSQERRNFEADPKNCNEVTGECPGVQNVILHAMQHQKMMALLAPPPQPMPAAQPHKPPVHPAPGAPPHTAPAPAAAPAPAEAA